MNSIDDVSANQPPGDDQSSTADARSLRIWPALILVALIWSFRFGAMQVEETSLLVVVARMVIPAALSAAVILWWLALSRATWRERVFGTLGLFAIIAITMMASDQTVRGFGTVLFAFPWGMSAFAIGACLVRRSVPLRTYLALASALFGFGYWSLIRTEQILANFDTVQRWRWEPSAEQRTLEKLAARTESRAKSDPGEPLAEPQWSQFRGPDRRGEQPGIILGEDWQTDPPQEVWRIPVGPGWSSFSVAGDRLFTQEQREDDEVVVCYSAADGNQRWIHRDESRFWEVVGGAGPRGTPTIADGSLFALGANGLLNRLDPTSGELIWQVDIRDDANREPPTWGFSSSPLVTHGVVIVHAGGDEDRGLLAYDQTSGDLVWGAPAGDHSYSSAQLATVDGRQCVLMLTNTGLVFVDPGDGALLGEHEWFFDGYRVIQPLSISATSLLIGTPMGNGTQRLVANWDGERFETEDEWTSNRMSPYFNDYVVHKGFLYGFDNNIFSCLDLHDGSRRWKRGRYGNGQVLLLPSGDQLLVTTERGEIVLLKADPDSWTELGRHKVFQSRCWNHPVLIGDRLYVRNAEEAVCFEVKLQESVTDTQTAAAENTEAATDTTSE